MTKQGDFYEEDEPIEGVVRAFENGLPMMTWPPVEWGHSWFTTRPTVTHSANITLHTWKTWATPRGGND
jgi:hypothetical protein